MAEQVDEPLEPKLCGKAAWLTRTATNGDRCFLFKAPAGEDAQIWLSRCSRELAPGVEFYLSHYDTDGWQWVGPGVDRAREEGVDMRELPPPSLPHGWREHLATPHFIAA